MNIGVVISEPKSVAFEGLGREELQYITATASTAVAAVKEEELRRSYSIEDVLAIIGFHRKQVVILTVTAGFYAHCSVQMIMVTFASMGIREEWSWLKDQGLVFNTVLAASAFARLLSSLFLLPWIDIIGRFPFIIVCVCLSTLFSLVGCFAPNFTLFTILRFFASLFASTLPASTVVYSLEMVRTKDRALAATLTQLFSVLDVLLSIVLHAAFPQSSWRIAMTLTHLPTLIVLAITPFVWGLETPRFLAANRKDNAKAWKTLAALTPGGQQQLLSRLNLSSFKNVHFKGLEVEQIQEDEEEERRRRGGGKENGGRSAAQGAAKGRIWVRTVRSLLKALRTFLLNSDYQRTTMGLALIWTCQSFAHWGMSSYITTFYAKIQVHSLWAPVGSWAIMLPGQALMYLLMEHLGRLRSIKFFALCGSGTLVILAVSLALGDYPRWTWLKSTAFLTSVCFACYFFGGPIWGTIYGYSAECYPTVNRGTAMTLFATIMAISMLITTYIGVITVDDNRPWLFPIVWAALRFGVYLAALLPQNETFHQPLADKIAQNSDH